MSNQSPLNERFVTKEANLMSIFTFQVRVPQVPFFGFNLFLFLNRPELGVLERCHL